MTKATKTRRKPVRAPLGALRGYRFVGTVPAAPKGRRTAAPAPSTDTLAKFLALANAGALPNTLPKRRAAGPKGGFDMAEIMRLVALYGPLLKDLLPLLERLFKRDDKPVEDGGGDRPLPPGGEDQPAPTPPAARTPSRLEAKVYWITRKHQPGKVGGGRYMLSDEARDRIRDGKDPLQRGDRACFDVSPYDQNGVKYEGDKPLVLEHSVGGVGEIQQQEENDYTPVVLVPNVGEQVVPGFQGEITYQARGGGLTSNLIRLRVRPWAA